ncbi:MAG TPA: hypothetical protein EYO25_03915 [Candidatus Thioglobus sp.]|jgi:hypothetical protein|nr:hypothetical protein [Candidatus Thioglobus sp.]HIB31112.1 hypothetical protein [Candidatus Thioglobus sp.]HIB97556.1 hypothetical protein [Candidatus Thioglobus sp.]
MSIEFTESEITTIQKNLDNRWRKEKKQVQLADIEITKEGEENPSLFPAAVWEDPNSTFIIIKLGDFQYKSFFYYLTDKRFDTGQDEYNDLHECTDKLLKAQADFVLTKNTKGLNVQIHKGTGI